MTVDPAVQADGSHESAWIDVHCHCLPGIDDGPATMEDSIALCRALVADGLTGVIATPHQFGRYDARNDAAKIRSLVSELNERLAEAGVKLAVLPGADVRVDERIFRGLDEDRVLTLADRGRHLLLEQPDATLVDLRPLIDALRKRNIVPILSHPERHPALRHDLPLLKAWASLGAAVQVTADSLIGKWGSSAERFAWDLLERGLVDLIATDAHSVGRRPPAMSKAFEAIAVRIGRPIAHRICVSNPAAIWAGRDIEPLRARGVGVLSR